jgi:ferredoxin-NADP reductase/ferredoxin
MSIEIRYGSLQAKPETGESVLEALEKAGANIPSSCRAGVCHFCLLKVVSGVVPKRSQEGLDSHLKNSGHFKACVCFADSSIVCEPAHSADFRDFVTILSIQEIGANVVLVEMEKPNDFTFQPGQFATFRLDNGHARSYSLASLCLENSTKFSIHVRKVHEGVMSNWFHHVAKPGDAVWMEGPKGACTYYAEFPDEDLFLIGTGTGMAPLYGITQDAITHQHRGQISIIHGALEESHTYLVDEFQRLQKENSNITYERCVLTGQMAVDVSVGDLRKIALERVPSQGRSRVYLCGDPGLVRYLKKHIFLRGTSLKRIHADPFVAVEKK